MTPAARFQAAIEILDQINLGRPAEQVLTNWSRQSRFAGSKDRKAVRNIVFDVLRRRLSASKRGGGQRGRALVLGYLSNTGKDPREIFTAQGHAPSELTPSEIDTLSNVPIFTESEKLTCRNG